MAHALIPTPIGPLSIETTNNGISRLDFVRDLNGGSPVTPHRPSVMPSASFVTPSAPSVLPSPPSVIPSAARNLAPVEQRPVLRPSDSDPLAPWERDGVRASDAASSFIEAAITQLDEYFSGRRRRFDLPLDLHGTPFQQRVWQAIAAIPYGETLSYADIALAAGNPNAYRAAGTACGANRIVILIPCHRVIGSDRGLHGFGGGLDTKVWLLRHENAAVIAKQPPLAARSVKPALRLCEEPCDEAISR